MDKIIDLIFQNPIALIIIGILLVVAAISIIAIYVVAFIQGREVSFWPPKIGKRKEKTIDSKSQIDSETLILGQEKKITLTRTDIVFESDAHADIKALGISVEDIIDFVIEEARRHPDLFSCSFSSIPLSLLQNILLLSWNEAQVSVERLLNREVAYPSSESWFSCVSLYRQATTLKYRTSESKPIISELELRQIVNLYRKLLRNLKDFVSLNESFSNKPKIDISVFEPLLDEAEFAFFNENYDIGIVRLEALLSSIHKFLLSNAPHAPVKTPQNLDLQESLAPISIGKDEKLILVVDDNLDHRRVIIDMISSKEYRIVTATNGEEALKAIVDNDYDLVITDFAMPALDGGEVVTGIRKINPNTKILMLSVLGMSERVKNSPSDILLSKPVDPSDLQKAVRRLLE